MDWEISKENFQPLKDGRDPKCFNSPKKLSANTKTSLIEKERGRFLKEIEEYNGPDPLSVWLRFIKWTQETFKEGGHRAELLPLLERCTRELQVQESYKQDVRYLRVWIQYADCLSEPRDVFIFLQEHRIGQEFALFYLAYATYLELRGNYAKADAVYQLGIERMAHPVDRLRTKYQELQMRMARRIQRQERDGDEAVAAGQQEEQDENAAVRTALNRLQTRTRSGAPGSAAALPPSGIRAKRKALGPFAPPLAENSAGLDIYVDDEFRGARPQGSVDEFGLRRTGAGAGDSVWRHLPGLEQTRKENVEEPSVWAGKTMKQKRALLPSAVAPLDIPVDEELANSSPVRAPVQAPAGTLRQRLDRGPLHHLDEELQHDPLRLHKTPPQADVMEPPAKKRKDKKEEEQAYDVAAIGGNGEQEDISFEELRARKWLAARHAAPLSPVHDMETDISPSAQASEANERTGTPKAQDVRALPATVASPETSLTPVGKGSVPSETGAAFPQSFVVPSQTPSPGARDAADQMRLGRSSSEYSDGDMAWAAACAPMSIGKFAPQAKKPCLPKGLRPRAGTPHRSTTAAHTGPDPAQESLGAASLPAADDMQNLKVGNRTPLGQIALEVPPVEEGCTARGLIDHEKLCSATVGKIGVAAQARGSTALEHAKSRVWQTPARTESDITVATQEAFDAINSMFVSPRGMRQAGPFMTAGTASVRVPPQATAERAPSGIMSALRPRTIHRDVTITTRDAFDTINAMFNGALPEDAPWRTGANPGAAQVVIEPTITFATQEAFNAINNMMGAEAQQGYGVESVPPHPGTSTPPPGASSPNPPQPIARRRVFGSLPVPGRAALPGSESTPFGSMSPPARQTKVRRLSHDQRKHRVSQGPGFNPFEVTGQRSSPFPQGTHPSHDVLSGGLTMYEDTALLSPMQVGDSAQLAKPTEYITDNRWAGGLGSHAGRASLGECQTTGGGGLAGAQEECLPVYEDTTLIPNACPADGVEMSERTEFMPENIGAVRLAARGMHLGGPGAHGESLGDGGQGGEGLSVYEDTGLLDKGGLGLRLNGGFQGGGSTDNSVMVYEDTQFMTGPLGHGTNAGGAVAKAPVEIYEDTQFLTTGPSGFGMASAASAMQPNSPVVMYEDTQFMSENVAPADVFADNSALTTPRAHISSTLRGGGKKSQENGEDETPPSPYASWGQDQENQPPPGARQYSGERRDVGDPKVEAQVMQEIPVERLAALSIRLAPKRRLF